MCTYLFIEINPNGQCTKDKVLAKISTGYTRSPIILAVAPRGIVVRLMANGSQDC